MKRINSEAEEKIVTGEWISVEEASRISGKSIKTIYRHIKAGKLSKLDDYTVRGSRKYLVRREEIEALSRPMYALERASAMGNAIERQKGALKLIEDAQKGILDNIVNTRTEMRKLSTISRRRYITLLFGVCLLIGGFVIVWYKIEHQRMTWTDAWTKLGTSVQVSRKEQEQRDRVIKDELTTYHNTVKVRMEELERELIALKEERGGIGKKRKKKRFLGIF